MVKLLNHGKTPTAYTIMVEILQPVQSWKKSYSLYNRGKNPTACTIMVKTLQPVQ